MKITNRANLPLPIVKAVSNDPYTKGRAHLSITGLIAPARIKALERLHWNEIEEDAADRVWSLYGQIVHGILERAADPTEALTEERLFMERYGWHISGQFDRLAIVDRALQDWKMTSTYAIKDGPKPEWEAQLNCYRLLLKENGKIIPERLQIVALLRDWQKSKARHSNDYPQLQVQTLDVPVWEWERTEAYIHERLTAHGTAQHDLPECSGEDRWKKADAYAVIGDGNSRASAVHATREAAEADAEARSGKKKYHVEERIGENTRCMFYCPVSDFCDQWKAINPDRLGLMGGNRAA